MACALHRLVPAKPLMCFLLVLVLQQQGNALDEESVCPKQLLRALTLSPRKMSVTLALQSLESKGMLLSPFCFALGMGVMMEAAGKMQWSRLLCQPLPYLGVCNERGLSGLGMKVPQHQGPKTYRREVRALGRNLFSPTPQISGDSPEGRLKACVFFFLFWF